MQTEMHMEWMGVWDRGRLLPGLRIGVPREYFPAELSRDISEWVQEVVSGLQVRGATVVPVSLPSTVYALSTYYVLVSAEASSNMACYDGVQYGLQVRPPAVGRAGRMYAHMRKAAAKATHERQRGKSRVDTKNEKDVRLIYVFVHKPILYKSSYKKACCTGLHLWIDAVLRCFVLFHVSALGIINA